MSLEPATAILPDAEPAAATPPAADDDCRASTSFDAQLGANCTEAHVPTNATPLKHAPSTIRRSVGPISRAGPPDAAPAAQGSETQER